MCDVGREFTGDGGESFWWCEPLIPELVCCYAAVFAGVVLVWLVGCAKSEIRMCT